MRIALPATIDPRAFASVDRAAPIVTLGGETMGTTWRVLYAARDVDAVRLDAAVRARLADLVAQMSHWAPDSRLSRFNDAPAGSWHALSRDLATVMRLAARIAAQSEGAFDPAIGALVDLWGFGPPGAMPPPDAATVADARRRSGLARLAWDDATARLRQPGGVRLDLSGIAKGYAVDTVADLLAAAGVTHMLAEIGGELVGRGIRPDGEPWWVDLETPPDLPLPPLRIALHELAVATSGSYVRGDHNLDPRSGRPAAADLHAVSVIAASAAEADGWATALLVLGRDAGARMAERHDLAARFATRDGEWLSPALRAML